MLSILQNAQSWIDVFTTTSKIRKIKRRVKVYELSRIYTGDFFACDFLIKMDVAKLHLFNNGSHCDESYLTAENGCLKLFPFR